jgi:hypothetical protein
MVMTTQHDKALSTFTEYFVRNYPGPDTVIFDPKWHAPKLFHAAMKAIEAAGGVACGREPIAYACSTRPNHLWSAAQFNNADPKNRTDCDIPLHAPLHIAGKGDEGEPVAWCQPDFGGEIHPQKFMVVYEDAEMGSAIFDNETEAHDHFEKAIINWNCYLFGLLPRQFSPAVRGGVEPNWWEEWVKTTRAYNALAKAAQSVIDETDAIHDNDPVPTKYRVPYGSITKLREVIASSDRGSLVSPPSRSEEGSDKP